MMKELSKEELIDRLDTMLIRTCADYDKCESGQLAEEGKELIRQAYQQLRQLIENQLKVDEKFIEKWEEYIYDVDNYSELDITTRRDIIKKILRDAGVQIKEENT